MTTAWKTSPLFIRDPIHQSPLTLTADNSATQTFVNYPPYFTPGSEVTEEQVLSFSSSLSKEGCLFVYGPCYLVIRTKGKGKTSVWGVHLRVSLSHQPPSCKEISCHWSWAFSLFFKPFIVLVSWGCCNTQYHKVSGLEQQKLILSQFWRLTSPKCSGLYRPKLIYFPLGQHRFESHLESISS